MMGSIRQYVYYTKVWAKITVANTVIFSYANKQRKRRRSLFIIERNNVKLSDLASNKNRWWALVFLALGLGIVIIDNSVLNVAIPYILRDLNTSFDAIQWVISGYALIIATILIMVGRVGDIYGRKRIFLLGTVLFAVGSFIASISRSVGILFLGEAFIEAIGAAMMLTSSLSLLVNEFEGRERALAFGVWGSVAGAAAALGPLLGGYLTTYHSWRWSLRINVFVAIVALLGSVFIKESKGEQSRGFDWWGTVFSALGLFSLVFALIEGGTYGWWHPAKLLTAGQWQWASQNISVIPFVIAFAVIFLALFIWWEYEMEKGGRSPLMRLSMFRSPGFSFGLITLVIVSLGQFGSFFVLPIFLQNVLGLNAFRTGLVFLASSVAIFISGPLSGNLVARVHNPGRIVTIGMFLNALGVWLMGRVIGPAMSPWDLAPGLIVFGLGVGASSAQLTNVILSNVRPELAGEASAVNNTVRQVGTSIGVAILGMVLATTLASHIATNIRADAMVPEAAKQPLIAAIKSIDPESGQRPDFGPGTPPQVIASVNNDVKDALAAASRYALLTALVFLFAGAVFSIFIPSGNTNAPQPGERPPSAH